jgi:hypothetical protein
MSSKTTRLEIPPETVPDALVGMSQKVRRILAEYQVACLLDRSARCSGFDRVLSGRHRYGSELTVNVSLSGYTRGVLLDHGGA